MATKEAWSYFLKSIKDISDLKSWEMIFGKIVLFRKQLMHQKEYKKNIPE